MLCVVKLVKALTLTFRVKVQYRLEQKIFVPLVCAEEKRIRRRRNVADSGRDLWEGRFINHPGLDRVWGMCSSPY
jgi:hypothetical protein